MFFVGLVYFSPIVFHAQFNFITLYCSSRIIRRYDSWVISLKNVLQKNKKKTQSEEAQTRYWKDDPKTKKSWAQFTHSMKKAATNKAQSDKTAVDTAKHGIKFYDKKGSGRIVKGKKIYN